METNIIIKDMRAIKWHPKITTVVDGPYIYFEEEDLFIVIYFHHHCYINFCIIFS